SSAPPIRGGVKSDGRANAVINGNRRNVIQIRWNTPLNGRQGAFGYYELISAGPTAYQQAFATTSNVQSNVNGVFVQDTWAVNSRLTINGGVRTENENVPTYSPGA